MWAARLIEYRRMMTNGINVDAGNMGRLRVSWREAGAGTPALLVHPYPTDSRIWQPQLEAAARGDIRVRAIALDLPGFGASAMPDTVPEAFIFEDLVTVAAGIVGHLGLRRPVLAGIGIGGTIVAALASQVHARALVLGASKIGSDPVDRRESREAMARDVVRQGSRSLSQRLASAALSHSANATARDAVEKMISEADPRAIAALGRLIARRPDITSYLAGYRGRVHIIAGGDDVLSPPSSVSELALCLSGARFTVAAGSGHFLPIEAPAEVGRVLSRAVSDQGRRTTFTTPSRR